MPWMDESNWDDLTVWSDTDDLDNVTETKTSLPTIQDTRENTVRTFPPAVPVPGTISQTIALTTDTQVTDLFPQNSIIDKIIFVETTGNTGQISCGITDGGFEVFTGETITGSTQTILTLNKFIPDGSALYFHAEGAGDTWNSMSATAYIIIWSLYQS